MSSIGLKDEIASELMSLGGETKEVTWSGFVKAMSGVIISKYKGETPEIFKRKWRKLFLENSRALKIKVVRGSDQGDVWEEEIVNNLKVKTAASSIEFQYEAWWKEISSLEDRKQS